ncbi:hypothetical protein D3C86_1494270 [compost metagenome]
MRDPQGRTGGPETGALDGIVLLVLRPILKVHVQAVEGQAGWYVRAAGNLRRLQAMTHQHKIARERFVDDHLADEITCGRRVRVNAVRHHFTVGQAADAGLIQGAGGAPVEMNASVEKTASTDRVVATSRLGQVGQLHQWIEVAFEWMTPVFQRGRARGRRNELGIGRRQDRRAGGRRR